MKQPLPPPRVIAIDVDGTLVINGRGNQALIEWIRGKVGDGYTIILWSSRGEQHARETASRLGICYLFTHILSKPGYIVDDNGWSWIKYTRVVRGFAEKKEAQPCESHE